MNEQWALHHFNPNYNPKSLWSLNSSVRRTIVRVMQYCTVRGLYLDWDYGQRYLTEHRTLQYFQVRSFVQKKMRSAFHLSWQPLLAMAVFKALLRQMGGAPFVIFLPVLPLTGAFLCRPAGTRHSTTKWRLVNANEYQNCYVASLRFSCSK